MLLYGFALVHGFVLASYKLKKKKSHSTFRSSDLISKPKVYCVVPVNIHTLPMGGHWKFQGGGGFQQSKYLRESMKLNWKFQGGGRVQMKQPSMGEVWIFSGTTHFNFLNVKYLKKFLKVSIISCYVFCR